MTQIPGNAHTGAAPERAVPHPPRPSLLNRLWQDPLWRAVGLVCAMVAGACWINAGMPMICH